MENYNTSTPIQALYEAGEMLYHLRKNRYENEDKPTKLDHCLSTLQNVRLRIRDFGLDMIDTSVMSALAYWRFSKSESQLDFGELLHFLRPLRYDPIEIQEHLLQLFRRGYIELKRPHRHTKASYINSEQLLHYNYKLHPRWFRHLRYNEPFIPSDRQAEPTVEMYMSLWFDFISELDANNDTFLGVDGTMIDAALAEISEMESYPAIAESPMLQFFREYDLDRNERLIVAILLHDCINNQSHDIDDILKLITDDGAERLRMMKYFTPESKLRANDIIGLSESRGFLNQDKRVALNTLVALRLIGSKNVTNRERLANFIAGSDLISIVEPKKGMDDLIISDELRKNLLTAVSRYENDTYGILTEWGLYKKKKSRSKTYRPKLVMLFHGPPGTGKTLAAEVMAATLSRDLVVTDCSKLLNAFVGESQKNISRDFSLFAEMNARLETPPILLLNEADQLLMHREGGRNDSVDKMYHQMQNLMLEAFEDMQGIVILTSNLMQSFDPAFSRRFDLKIEFPAPDTSAREAIWRIHLMPTIPGADTVNVSALAEYNLSGGQISVVVENAATEAATLDESHRRLTTELLLKYARLEAGSSFSGESKKPVGFCVNRLGAVTDCS
jgi:hypothetical protein